MSRCSSSMVIARLSLGYGRPVPSPSGTAMRTPAAGLERIRPSSVASPSIARSTATC